jgi:hypothetical protein
MCSLEGARATPAAAECDPQVVDRLGGSINEAPTTAGTSTASLHRDREWWKAESARIGTNWQSIGQLALEIIGAMGETPFQSACRVAGQNHQPRQRPPMPVPRPTAQSTIEAVLHCVRERGLAALKEPANVERLRRCDAAAKRQINDRIAKMTKGPPNA